MKSAKPGANTSGVELLGVSLDGLRLVIDGHERFLAFDDFPWFRNATTAQLATIERPSANHLRWPALDVDLSLESIDHPQDFPLVSGHSSRDGRR